MWHCAMLLHTHFDFASWRGTNGEETRDQPQRMKPLHHSRKRPPRNHFGSVKARESFNVGLSGQSVSVPFKDPFKMISGISPSGVSGVPSSSNRLCGNEAFAAMYSSVSHTRDLRLSPPSPPRIGQLVHSATTAEPHL